MSNGINAIFGGGKAAGKLGLQAIKLPEDFVGTCKAASHWFLIGGYVQRKHHILWLNHVALLYLQLTSVVAGYLGYVHQVEQKLLVIELGGGLANCHIPRRQYWLDEGGKTF